MRGASAVLLIVTIFVASCGDPLGPEYALTLSIEDSVVAKRSPDEVTFAVAVRVSNHDSRTVFYDQQCGHALQRREGTGWRTVFSPVCRPSPYSMGIFRGESRLFDIRTRASVTSSTWPAVGAAGEYRVILWLTSVPNNSYGFAPKPLGPRSRTSPTFSSKEVVIVFGDEWAKKEEPPRKMGLASSAGAFPLALIDDSVRCAAPECSHVNHLALVERVRLRCLAARETSVVSSDLTTRTSIRTFEAQRSSDVSPERIHFRKPVTEAEGEYTKVELLVKRNFSTTFSRTIPRNFVENSVNKLSNKEQQPAKFIVREFFDR